MDYSQIPINKKIINRTGNDIKFDLRDNCKQNLIDIKNNNYLQITLETSEALALLKKKCYELGLILEDTEPEVEITLDFTATSETNEFEKGKTGTVRFDTLGNITTSTTGEDNVTVSVISKNRSVSPFEVVTENNKTLLTLKDNLDVGEYKCTLIATDNKGNKSNKVDYNISVLEPSNEYHLELNIVYDNCTVGETGTLQGDVIGTLTVVGGTPEYNTVISAPFATPYDNNWTKSAYFSLVKTEANENIYDITILHDLMGAARPRKFPLKVYVTDSEGNETMVATEINASND